MKRIRTDIRLNNSPYSTLTEHQERLIEELNPLRNPSYRPTAEQDRALRALALARPSSSRDDLVVLRKTLNALDREDEDGALDNLLCLCHNNVWPLNFGHLAELSGTTAFPARYNVPDARLIAHVLRNCQQIVDLDLNEFAEGGDCLQDMLNALQETSHLKRFTVQFEDADKAVGTSMAHALQSHLHLEALDLSLYDHPEKCAPELLKGLDVWSGSLQSFSLFQRNPWPEEFLADLGNSLRQIPTLRRVSLVYHASCDMSPFINALADANHPASQLRCLDLVRGEHTPPAHAEAIAGALIAAIERLPNLQTLAIDEDCLDLLVNEPSLLRMVKENGMLRSLRTHRKSDALPPPLVQQLKKNKEQVSARSPEMFQAASKVFASTIASINLSGVNDIAKVITEYTLGAKTPADLRECQNMLFVSKKVWQAASEARFNAQMTLVTNQLRSKAPASLTHQT
jgi:hypothetical protein